MSPSLTVLIVNWNSWSHLRRCLLSLSIPSGISHEVVVIDNASGDGSVEKLARSFPTVNVHANTTNIGHVRGVNQGFRLAQGEHVLLLDADTVLHPGAVEGLLDFLRAHPEAALVAPRTLNADGSVQETARNFPTVLNGLFGRQSLLTRLFPNNPFSWRYLARDRLHQSTPFQVEWVSAACMLFRRQLLQSCGHWDESFEGYWVDADWCMRLKRQGQKIYCVPAARIVHVESNRADRKKTVRRIWMFHQGALRLYRKHYTWGALDPRGLLAAAVLSSRAALLMLRNLFLTDDAESGSGSKASSYASEENGRTNEYPAVTEQGVP